MASSGSKSVTVTSWDTLKFSWEESSQSIPNNTTTISWKLQLIATGSGRISSSVEKDWSVTVNGTKYSGTNYVSIANNTTKTLASGSTTISHNADGKKTFSFSFSQEFAITFSGSYIGTKSGSGSGTLDTIPRTSKLTVANGTLGTAQTLTITENASAFNHKLYYTCGSSGSVYILGSASATSSSLSTSWTPPLSLSEQNTTGTSVSITFHLQTYNGTTLIGTFLTTKTFTIPTSVKPSCSISVTDPVGLEVKYGAFVKGLSQFKVVVTPTLAYKSPIASYNTTANGSKYTAASFTTGYLQSFGTLKVAATVKDKRGRSGSANVSKTVLDYTAPAIKSMTVRRCNADGTENDQGDHVQVLFSATVTALNDLNTAKYVLRYKKSSASSYTDTVEFSEIEDSYTVTDHEYIFAAETGSSYSIELKVTDNHKTSTRITSASTGFTLMNWKADGTGMAIGKVAEEPNLFDVGLPARFRNGIAVDAEWTALTLDSAFKCYNDNSNNVPKYKAQGNIVTVRGVVSPVTAYTSSNTQVVIATGIPSALRPKAYDLQFICQGSGMNRWTCTVTTGGIVKVSRYGIAEATTVPTTAWLTFCVTYMV